MLKQDRGKPQANGRKISPSSKRTGFGRWGNVQLTKEQRSQPLELATWRRFAIKQLPQDRRTAGTVTGRAALPRGNVFHNNPPQHGYERNHVIRALRPQPQLASHGTTRRRTSGHRGRQSLPQQTGQVSQKVHHLRGYTSEWLRPNIRVRQRLRFTVSALGEAHGVSDRRHLG